MQKKSEIIGEYILTINDDNSVNVSMIPDNTKEELCKIAKENNIPHDDKLTTHQLGALIIKELGKKGENTLTFGEYEIEKEPGGRINLLKTYGNTKEGLRQISEQIGFEYNKEWNTQQFGRNLMNFIVKRDEEVATTPGNFVVNSTTTVGDLNKQFQSLYGGYLKVYNGRSVAKEDEKLVDIGAKTGEFSCRASRTVGSFVEAMKETFGLKVKVWTADEWVTVLDGITLSKVRDLPKQATKAVLEAYESYKRENKEDSNQNNTSDSHTNLDTAELENSADSGEELLEEEDIDTGLYGFKRENDQSWVINPMFSEVRMFFKGVCPAKSPNNEKWGLINTKGEWLTQPIFRSIGDFYQEGYSVVKDDKINYGLIGLDGKLLFEPKFGAIYGVSEDLITALDRDSDLYGYSNIKGNWIIDPIFDYAYNFRNGIAEVEKDGNDYEITNNGLINGINYKKFFNSDDSESNNLNNTTMNAYDLANKIIEYSNENPGDFELLIKEDGLEIFVEGYAYSNNSGGEGEITNFEIRKGKLSDDDIQIIKDEFYGATNWS